MNEQPTHLDLFSGIGGFALAAGWAGFKTIGFCEIDPYCQGVLKKHWPNAPIYRDIKALDGTTYRGISLLTGGFPCQPFSVAGKQRGKTDDRYLWPEMLRVIREARPAWIIGENVAGIVNMALDQVHTDLEAEGYEVESLIIPACGVDAWHKRERAWIIANSTGIGIQGLRSGGKQESCPHEGQALSMRGCEGSEYAKWTSQPVMDRVVNGLPNRVDRIKGLGNAIVPQVAYQIIKGIRELL